MKAVIDRSNCISCGLCADTCPEIFRMADDGLAEVYAEMDNSTIDSVKEARDNCPVSIISIEE